MGVKGILMIFTFFAFVQGSTSSSCDALEEPCFLHNNVEIPNIETRHPDIEMSQKTIAEKYCDLFALDPNIWYRSTYNMTTHVVQWQKCGTNHPIWLNGTIPGPTDGTVSRTACVRGFFEECELTYTVQIKNCNYYTVYCFPNVPDDCHQRYCFDIDRTVFTTTEPTPSTHAGTTSALRMSPTCPECSTQGKLSGKGFSSAVGPNPSAPRSVSLASNIASALVQNSLAVFLVTFGTCAAVFGVTMVTVLYLIRRKVSPEAKYAYPTKKSMNRVEMPVPVEQPYTTFDFYRKK